VNGYYSRYENTSICLGLFATDQTNGFGVHYISAKELTIGEWKDGVLNGPGLEVTGEVIRQGSFNRGKLEGPGVSINSSGVRYTGDWQAGLRHGRGITSYPAEYFNGTWTQGIHASGTFNYTSAYRRNYEHSLELSWPLDEVWLYASKSATNSEGRYTGQISSQGLRHGYGVQHYSNGAVYKGHWNRDLPHGYGRLTNDSMGVFTGYWHDGAFTDGTRRQTKSISSVYWSGAWNDKFQLNGFGFKKNNTSVSSEFLFGDFVNGNLHGVGALITNTSMIVGKWTDGQFGGNDLTEHSCWNNLMSKLNWDDFMDVIACTKGHFWY